jgi:hypothetical protein
MKWSADRQGYRFLAIFLYSLNRPLDRFRMASNDDLTRTIKIGRGKNLAG